MPFDPTFDKARVDAMPQNIRLDKEINHQDQNDIVKQVGAMAFEKFSNAKGRRGDAQVASVSEHMATVYLQGFYGKRPLKTYWAEGKYISISDDAPPGADEVVYSTAGSRFTEVDDGIYADNVSPEREVDDALEDTRQRYLTIKHKITITQQDIWRAAVTGYDKFKQKGVKLREAHMNALNSLIRRGNSKYKLHGITNHPGIKRRVASANWSTGTATDVYADAVSAIAEMADSATEEDTPTRLILPRLAMNNFNTAQKSTASDRMLREALETAYSMDGFMVMPDPGMKTASSLGGPAALLYTDAPDLVSVSTPLFQYMHGPREVDAGVLEIQVWTRFAGVQVRDVDTIMVIEGDSAGW